MGRFRIHNQYSNQAIIVIIKHLGPIGFASPSFERSDLNVYWISYLLLEREEVRWNAKVYKQINVSRISSSVRFSGYDEYWNNQHVPDVPAGTT
jgi:hypothetical protein